MTVAPAPSFICQSASVAADAGAANATTTATAAVIDDPSLNLISVPLLLAVPHLHAHMRFTRTPHGSPARGHDSRRPEDPYIRVAKRSVAATTASAIPASDVPWPAPSMSTSSASGQARASSHAVSGGLLISMRP